MPMSAPVDQCLQYPKESCVTKEDCKWIDLNGGFCEWTGYEGDKGHGLPRWLIIVICIAVVIPAAMVIMFLWRWYRRYTERKNALKRRPSTLSTPILRDDVISSDNPVAEPHSTSAPPSLPHLNLDKVKLSPPAYAPSLPTYHADYTATTTSSATSSLIDGSDDSKAAARVVSNNRLSKSELRASSLRTSDSLRTLSHPTTKGSTALPGSKKSKHPPPIEITREEALPTCTTPPGNPLATATLQDEALAVAASSGRDASATIMGMYLQQQEREIARMKAEHQRLAYALQSALRTS